MKKLHIFLLPAALAAVFIIQQSHAQEVISNSLISSGASTSSNSSYTFTGTVGQPAIGESSNASYTLISDVEKEEEGNKPPTDYKLFQNYPNPFNPETTIKFRILKLSFVTIKIYNILGVEVKTLVSDNIPSGTYSTKWDGTDNYGRTVSSGVYIYMIRTNTGFVKSRKLLLIK